MEDLFKFDGRRFSAKISEVYCEGVITVENNRIYLCQNIKYGGSCRDKKGFKCSWFYKDSEGNIDRHVTDFHLLEEPQEGDWVYVSNKSPECKEKCARIFLHKTKAGAIMCVPQGKADDYLNGRDFGFGVLVWKYMRIIPKEEPVIEITVEEALEIIAKQKGISVENLRLKK